MSKRNFIIAIVERDGLVVPWVEDSLIDLRVTLGSECPPTSVDVFKASLVKGRLFVHRVKGGFKGGQKDAPTG